MYQLAKPGNTKLHQCATNRLSVIADAPHWPHLRKLPVVFAQLADHFLRTHAFFIVVFQPSVARDIADRMDRRSADLARPLGDRIRYGEDLRCLFIEQQMIIAKVPPADMPVKFFRFHVQREQSASSRRKLLVISSTASPLRSVGVVSFVAIALSPFELRVNNEALYLHTGGNRISA